MPDAVERFLAGYDPEIRDLAPTLRKLVQRVAPDAEEKVPTAWKTTAYDPRNRRLRRRHPDPVGGSAPPRNPRDAFCHHRSPLSGLPCAAIASAIRVTKIVQVEILAVNFPFPSGPAKARRLFLYAFILLYLIELHRRLIGLAAR